MSRIAKYPVVIPEKVDWHDPFIDIAQITQIVANSAATVGVIWSILKK